MSENSNHLTDRELRTPRAAAITGILFAVLFSTSYSLILYRAPGASADIASWLARDSETVMTGVSLLPFAAIAFLWFMGVVRDSLGHLEDQFFSTLFFGSGLLYLAMTLMSAGLASGALNLYVRHPEIASQTLLLDLVRAVSNETMTIYALRMAGMFMFVLGTIWVKTGLMPRWLIGVTYLAAVVLMLSVGQLQWIIMLFPGWVFLVSVLILVSNYRRRDTEVDGS
jgi:hypothetical protein